MSQLFETKIHRSYKVKPKENAYVEIWCRSDSVIIPRPNASDRQYALPRLTIIRP